MKTIVAMAIVTLVVSACAKAPVPTVVERRIEVPASLLKCAPEPTARAPWKSQKDVGIFMIELARAGEDCRSRLEGVAKIVGGGKNFPGQGKKLYAH